MALSFANIFILSALFLQQNALSWGKKNLFLFFFPEEGGKALFVSLSQFSLKTENGWTRMDKAQKPKQPFLPGIAE